MSLEKLLNNQNYYYGRYDEKCIVWASLCCFLFNVGFDILQKKNNESQFERNEYPSSFHARLGYPFAFVRLTIKNSHFKLQTVSIHVDNGLLKNSLFLNGHLTKHVSSCLRRRYLSNN